MQTSTKLWYQCGGLIVAAVAAPMAEATPRASSAMPTACYINGRPVSACVSAGKYLNRVRSNPRRRAAMDRVAGRIADRLTQDMGGETIVSLRLRKGFTQSELAKAAGVQQSYLSRIEHNQYSLHTDTLSKLAAVLEVSVDEVRNAFNRQWEYLEKKA